MPKATRPSLYAGWTDGRFARAAWNGGAPPVGLAVWLIFAMLVLGAPASAHAWTQAQVRGAEADVHVLADGRGQIRLAVRIHISGGWLSELELPGIPDDAEFDPSEAATLIAATGESYPPTLVLRRGVWRVTFPSRRTAPWRGDYVLTLSYRGHLVSLGNASEETQRLQWTMPPWRSGIEAAKIRVDAPAGTASADPVETGIAYSVTREASAERVVITHERTQLPRDTEWVVTFDIPKPAGEVRPQTAAPIPTQVNRTVSDSVPVPPVAWWPLVAFVLSVLKRSAVTAVSRKRGLVVRPLLPGVRPRLRTAVRLVLALVASWVGATQPLLAAVATAFVVALSVDRDFEVRGASALQWSVASPDQLRPSVWRRLRAAAAPNTWLDITSPLGALTLAGTYGGLWWLGRVNTISVPVAIVIASLITPLWCTATRLHFPWAGAEMARLLSAWHARNARALADVLASTPTPLVGHDREGGDRDARMPLQLASPQDGMRSLDLVVVTDARTLTRQVALLVQVAATSPADRHLREIPRTARRTIDGGVVYVVGSAQILAALAPRARNEDSAVSSASEPGLEAA